MKWYYKKLHIKNVTLVLIFLISTFFLLTKNTKNILADLSSVCCNVGDGVGDYCTISMGPPPVLGRCRLRDPDILPEAFLCTSPDRLFCDDDCCNPSEPDIYCHPSPGYTGACDITPAAGCAYNHKCSYAPDPGNYQCNCVNGPYGQYNCTVWNDNCNNGYKPDCYTCGPDVYNDPCGGVRPFCTLTCIAGNRGGAGAPCVCNADCLVGLYCNPYSNICIALPTTPGVTQTPTPSNTYNCSWNPNPGPGYGCSLVPGSDDCGPGCNADCSHFYEYDPNPRLRCNGQHDCICPTPTSGNPLPTIYYDQCGKYCDQNSGHPYGNCLKTRRDDICVRPPSDPYGQIDCLIDGVTYDCWCCTELLITPSIPPPTREELNPLCAGQQGINTAIGCIPVGDQNTFLAFVLRWALGIAGGVAFILIVYGGFLYMTSGGDKQKVQAAKELLTAAVSGLLLLIFSVFLLDLLGVRILQIPGLV